MGKREHEPAVSPPLVRRTRARTRAVVWLAGHAQRSRQGCGFVASPVDPLTVMITVALGYVRQRAPPPPLHFRKILILNGLTGIALANS